MKELDKRLEAAYSYEFTPVVGGTQFETHVDVEAIKQAFIDAGWAPFTPDGKVKVQELVNKRGLMTGQEWYRKFEKEIDKKNLLGLDPSGALLQQARDGALRAAKKAAGIEQ